MHRPSNKFRYPLLGAALAALVLTSTTALAGSGVGGVFNLGQLNTVDAQTALSGNPGGSPQLKLTNNGTNAGIRVDSQTGIGVNGVSVSGTGQQGQSQSGIGLLGIHAGSTGLAAGVEGRTASTDAGGAGVLGRNTGGGPGLRAVVNAGAPPLAVNSGVKVTNLNADKLDDLDSSALQKRVSGTCAAGEAIRIVNADGSVTCAPVSAIGGWSLTGNAGTNPGTNFLGTTDNKALELKVNGQRALRLEPAASPNVIGGWSGNVNAGNINNPTPHGVTIAGGGCPASICGSDTPNKVTDSFGTVSGGRGNSADFDAAVGGGLNNNASSSHATVGGGQQNTAAYYGTVAGGAFNSTSGLIGVVGGGLSNAAGGDYSTIGGGQNNATNGDHAVVSGGESNSANGTHATISGGGSNSAGGIFNTVGGGSGNQTNNDYSTVGGGQNNKATSGDATVGGGFNNAVTGGVGTIGGGQNNSVTAGTSAIAGGSNNSAANGSAVGGGVGNAATGTNSTVPGGENNAAVGARSFAAGTQAKATFDGSFVWSDMSFVDLNAPGPNTFTARANNGFWFGRFAPVAAPVTLGRLIDTDTGAGLSLGGTWDNASDRALKSDFRRLDRHAVLEQVARMPLSSWTYKAEKSSVRHIGPTAQDFYRAFGLGLDNKHISTVDEGGVALAAIQGLYRQNRQLRTVNQRLNARLTRLERQVGGLSRR